MVYLKDFCIAYHFQLDIGLKDTKTGKKKENINKRLRNLKRKILIFTNREEVKIDD